MRSIWPQLKSWIENKEPFALATVVSSRKSTPGHPGAMLAINAAGDFIGSVSAGCVEASVLESALKTIEDGQIRHLTVGPEEGTPWEIALSCGGTVTIRIEKLPAPDDRNHLEAFIDNIASVMASSREGVLVLGKDLRGFWSEEEGWLESSDGFSPDITEHARTGLLENAPVHEEEFGQGTFLFYPLRPLPRLFIIGANAIAIHLTALAHNLQFETIVIDPRSAYAKIERFYRKPHALHCAWPEAALSGYSLRSNDFAVVLTHDAKIDQPALKKFIEHSCRYIGALGSRRTHANRVQHLITEGLEEEAVRQIRGPAGLSIGSQVPMEIALSIAAEIVLVRNDERIQHSIQQQTTNKTPPST